MREAASGITFPAATHALAVHSIAETESRRIRSCENVCRVTFCRPVGERGGGTGEEERRFRTLQQNRTQTKTKATEMGQKFRELQGQTESMAQSPV